MDTNNRTAHLSGVMPGRELTDPECIDRSAAFIEFPKSEVEQSIPERFEKIVRRFPDSIAVRNQERHVSYAELDSLADGVAQAVTIRQAQPVGILLGQGIEQIAAMLGVLKGGNFFVLLDPAWPASRLSTIVQDSGAKWVISSDPYLHMGRHLSGDIQFIEFESLQGVTRSGGQGTILPGENSYLAFTSGSTGRPKAIVQTHRNLLHRVMLHARVSQISHEDSVAQLTSGTSNAITTAFYALLNGATLCLFDVRQEGISAFASWLVRSRISICFLSATLFRSLCQVLTGSENFPDLRSVKFRSESASIEDVRLFRKFFSSECKLVHSLSSTETGTLCDYVIHRDMEIPFNELPVGYQAQDKEILILSEDGRTLGPCEIGEITVRSRYLSPGYWQLPELTKAKFKPDTRNADQTIYHTGDLGVMLPDGCLIHKGRKDLRIKIRGYAVDLKEVERTLLEHPLIVDAGVTAWGQSWGEKYLAGYIVASANVDLHVSEIRHFLRTKLPDYMIPSKFVFLAALPLTNGKLDRRALKEPGNERPNLDEPYIPADADLEKELVRIWSDVLAVDRVGIRDNFLDLGGHSLAASRVVSRVIQSFQVVTPLRELLDCPTIAEMARVIRRDLTKKAEQREVERMLTAVEAISDAQAEKLLTE